MTAHTVTREAPAADLLTAAANAALDGTTLRTTLTGTGQQVAAQSAAYGALAAVLAVSAETGQDAVTAVWTWDLTAPPELRYAAAMLAARLIRRAGVTS